MRKHARLAAVSMVLSAVVSASLPASADTSRDEVAKAKQRAAQLAGAARADAAAATSAHDRLLELSALANAALARAEATARAVDAARAEASAADARATASTQAADNARQVVQDYARNAYIAGEHGGQLGSLVALVHSGSATDMLSGLALLDHIGGSLSEALLSLRSAERDQAESAQQVHVTLAGLEQAELDLRHARTEARQAIAHQRTVLADAQARAAATAAQAHQAKTAAEQMSAELAAEIAAARARAAAGGGAALCKGGDISAYPNGQIPVELLCALYGAPAEALREDAASQFNAMSRDYEREFGSAICVADSYRTYERQQQIYQERPGYAATPGTSEHGWARAVDLCGGIQTDGTAQNTWLRLHASQYNWFHPGWADSAGGGPYEPWHWEYAG